MLSFICLGISGCIKAGAIFTYKMDCHLDELAGEGGTEEKKKDGADTSISATNGSEEEKIKYELYKEAIQGSLTTREEAPD